MTVTIPLPLLLSLALLLGAWLTWLAVRRADRRWLWARLVANLLAVACLFFLVSPPKITRIYNASEAILITEGYSTDTLEQLLKRLKPKPQVFYFGVTENKPGNLVKDLTAFQQEHPAVQTLHVLGHGLREEELAALDSIRLVPHLSPLPTGVLAASWPQKITLGKDLVVQGKFTSPEKATRLYLHAAGLNRDSVEVKKGVGQAFSLRFKPKSAGRFVYQLRWQQDDSTYQEPVPVQVEAPRLLSVLFLSSSPSFETKFLKNALARQGHGVAVRTQVSKGVFQTETVNLLTLALPRLTTALLQKFDVVLIDDVTLQGLSGSEKQILQQAVRQQGLGILTSVSQTRPKPIPFFIEAVFGSVSGNEAKNAPVQWAGQSSSQGAVPAPNVFLKPREHQQILAWGKTRAHAWAIHSRKGMGQVGVSLLLETFPWALEGKEAHYQQFWATLLSALAKPAPAKPFAFSPTYPAVNQPLLLTTTEQDIQVLKAGSEPRVSLSLQRESSLAYNTGLWWPQSSGWRTFESAGDTLSSVYVNAASAWETRHVWANQQRLKKASLASEQYPAGAQPKTHSQPFPLWPFWLVLLLCAAFLWVEEKF
ncbi:hypothetical protein [Rufibacter sp. LB8]|uniref:hypothetical protein n=1 Tax=Rufibacter sp. LB8 TaxID=2777781 RepID=UPI00178C2041|nr:hypothetical protein [Rufibacter sp. LB8]